MVRRYVQAVPDADSGEFKRQKEQRRKPTNAPAIKVDSPPKGKTYYMVGDECFTSLYARVFIKNKKVEK